MLVMERRVGLLVSLQGFLLPSISRGPSTVADPLTRAAAEPG